MNIAARLEALAQTGGISISKVIYDFVKGKPVMNFTIWVSKKLNKTNSTLTI